LRAEGASERVDQGADGVHRIPAITRAPLADFARTTDWRRELHHTES
jgi:hypothetical protein